MRMFSCRPGEALVHEPLFRRILGSRFEQLPVPLQRLHDTHLQGAFSGRCDIAGGASWPANVLARFMGLPRPADDVPVHVTIVCNGDRETWTRRFDTKRMRSRLTERNGKLVETVGPIQLAFELQVVDGGILWTAVRARLRPAVTAIVVPEGRRERSRRQWPLHFRRAGGAAFRGHAGPLPRLAGMR